MSVGQFCQMIEDIRVRACEKKILISTTGIARFAQTSIFLQPVEHIWPLSYDLELYLPTNQLRSCLDSQLSSTH